MTLDDVFDLAETEGYTLSMNEEGRLIASGPKGKMGDQLREAITLYRDQILALFRGESEPVVAYRPLTIEELAWMQFEAMGDEWSPRPGVIAQSVNEDYEPWMGEEPDWTEYERHHGRDAAGSDQGSHDHADERGIRGPEGQGPP